MSQANIPNITPNITVSREDAISLVIGSIALEEMGLSHIFNAEGEKIQYVLGTLENNPIPKAASVEEVLKLNESVIRTLQQATENQQTLRNKFEAVLEASEFNSDNLGRGPTGATGPIGAPNMLTGPTGATGLQGPTGVDGDLGAEGLTGPDGALGPTGLVGPNGQTGPAGAPGQFITYFNSILYWDQIDPTTLETGNLVVYNNYVYLVLEEPILPGELPGSSTKFEAVFPELAIGATGGTGAQGPPGPMGPQGAVGAQGERGIQGPMGMTGATGPTGPQGPPGAQVETLDQALIWNPAWETMPSNGLLRGTIVSHNNVLYMVLIDNPEGEPSSFMFSRSQALNADYVPIYRIGPDGATGPAGLQGITGNTGATGATGVTGSAGESSGITGATGAAGATGATGTAGVTGEKGATGATGVTGERGYDGIDINRSISYQQAVGIDPIPRGTMIRDENNIIVYMTIEEMSPADLGLPLSSNPYLAALFEVGATGATGAMGATGPAGYGAKGETGTKGPQGLDGATGPRGLTGVTGVGLSGYKVYPDATNPTPTYNMGDIVIEDGIVYVILRNNTVGSPSDPMNESYVDILAKTGPIGETGERGETGMRGATGEAGPTGAQGSVGAEGVTGATGLIGATGPTGETGPKGKEGIQGVTGPKGDTGAPAPPFAETGPEGDPGPQGNPGPQGATGHQGYANPTPPLAYCLITAPTNNTTTSPAGSVLTVVNNRFTFPMYMDAVSWGIEDLEPITSNGGFNGILLKTKGYYLLGIESYRSNTSGTRVPRVGELDLLKNAVSNRDLFQIYIYEKLTDTPEEYYVYSTSNTAAGGTGRMYAQKLRNLT